MVLVSAVPFPEMFISLASMKLVKILSASELVVSFTLCTLTVVGVFIADGIALLICRSTCSLPVLVFCLFVNCRFCYPHCKRRRKKK